MGTVSDVIKPREIYSVGTSDTVQQAVQYMCKHHTGAVAVRAEDKVTGIFSERDVLRRVLAQGLNPNEVRVGEVMSPKIISIRLEDDLRLAKALMFMNGVRHLLVAGKDDEYHGLLSMRDLVEADLADSKEIVQKLNDAYYEQAYRPGWRISSNRVIVETYAASEKEVPVEMLL